MKAAAVPTFRTALKSKDSQNVNEEKGRTNQIEEEQNKKEQNRKEDEHNEKAQNKDGQNEESKEVFLKRKIREYFASPNPLASLPKMEAKSVCEEQIAADTRSLVCMYRDNSFTGRAVARIFHGIQSPNYPAVIWGRCKFWRAHMAEDFRTICQIATREILRLR